MIGIVKTKDKRINSLKKFFKEAILSDNIYELSNIDILILPFLGIDRFGYIKSSELLLSDILDKNDIKIIYCGVENEYLDDIAKKRNIEIRYLMNDISFVNKNAHLTAEGLLRIISNNTAYSLSDLKITLLGYGYVGGAIAKYLNSYTRISIYTNNIDEIKKVLLSGNRLINNLDEIDCDILINTIPKPIVNKINNKNMKIYDVSSYPYGFSNEILELVEILPGIPANILPDSAAKIIYEKIIKEL
ncbi:MAG: hypothetical protein ACI35W_02250 [Anaeroplasmataceae bacterium]